MEKIELFLLTNIGKKNIFCNKTVKKKTIKTKYTACLSNVVRLAKEFSDCNSNKLCTDYICKIITHEKIQIAAIEEEFLSWFWLFRKGEL